LAKKFPKWVAKYSPRKEPATAGAPASDHDWCCGGGDGGSGWGGGGGAGGKGKLNRRAQIAPGTATGLGTQTASCRAKQCFVHL